MQFVISRMLKMPFIKYSTKVVSRLSFTQGSCSHRLCIEGGLTVSCRQVRASVVSALIIVVLHIQAGELRETNAKGTASIVDVLSI